MNCLEGNRFQFLHSVAFKSAKISEIQPFIFTKWSGGRRRGCTVPTLVVDGSAEVNRLYLSKGELHH